MAMRRLNVKFTPWLPWFVVGLALIVVPQVASSYQIYLLTLTMVYAIASLGVNIMGGYTGLWSLGHAGNVAIGAFAAASLAPFLPFWLVIPICALMSGIGGTLLLLPVARLRGHILVIASLGVSLAVPEIISLYEPLSGGRAGKILPKPDLFGLAFRSDASIYYFALFFFIVLTVVAIALVRSRVGRAFIAIRDDRDAAATCAIPVARYCMLSFAIASLYGGVAGALLAYITSYVGIEMFGMSLAMDLVIMTIIGGYASIAGSIAGAAYWVIGTLFLKGLRDWWAVANGLIVMILMLVFPAGIAGLLKVGLGYFRGVWDQWKRTGSLHTKARAQSRAMMDPGTAISFLKQNPVAADELHLPRQNGCARPAAKAHLKVDRLSVKFGGLTALDNVDLEVRTGEIVALIGPNGAGKTTLLNAITTHVPPSTGHILVGEKQVSGYGKQPHLVASKGLARTFQHIQLFESLSIGDQLLVGQHSRATSSVIGDILRSKNSRQDEKKAQERAEELLCWLGLDEYRDQRPSAIPYGIQKLVGLGRALVMSPGLLLLDEPAAGMTQGEAEKLALRLKEIRKKLGTTILLVDHNMWFVMGLADWIYVINFGRKIAEGTPDEIQCNPDVIDAYLGRERGEQRVAGI